MKENFFIKHADTLSILSSIVIAMCWMNGKFTDVNNQFHLIEKDLAVMKAVLITKDIMPKELAKVEK
jgi:hypothetical protein